jgi:hypothetical protein
MALQLDENLPDEIKNICCVSYFNMGKKGS